MDLYALQFWSYTCCLMVTLSVFFLALCRPPSKEQKLVLVISFITLSIMFGYWGSVSARIVSPDLLIFTLRIEYLGACSVFVLLLLLSSLLFNITLPKSLIACQVVTSVIMTAIAITFDKHTLFFKSYHVEFINGVTVLVREYGIFNLLYVVLIFAYMLIVGGLCVVVQVKGAKRDRTVSRYLFVAIFTPCLCYVLERLLNMQSFRLVPFGLMITSVSTLLLITLAHFSDMPEMAKEVIFDSLDDAVITIDNTLHLMQSNNKASALFPFIKKMLPGDRIAGLDGDFEALFAPLFDRPDKFPIDYWNGGAIYQPNIKPIFNKRGKLQGSILWLKDVTNERNYAKKLERDVTLQTNRILDMQNQMIISFAKLVENRDAVTGKHLERTRSYVLVIGMMLLKNDNYTDIIDYQWVETLSKVAPLHDIGKVSIADGILNKPGRLTPEEFDMMKKHTVYGAQILETTLKNCVDDAYYRMACEVARSHHERWDGKGYPDGLAGEQIPLSARVMAVADVFDALVTRRPYKPPFDVNAAFQMIKEESGSHFDPLVVKAFFDTKDMIIKIADELRDDDDEADIDELEPI